MLSKTQHRRKILEGVFWQPTLTTIPTKMQLKEKKTRLLKKRWLMQGLLENIIYLGGPGW